MRNSGEDVGWKVICGGLMAVYEVYVKVRDIEPIIHHSQAHYLVSLTSGPEVDGDHMIGSWSLFLSLTVMRD